MALAAPSSNGIQRANRHNLTAFHSSETELPETSPAGTGVDITEIPQRVASLVLSLLRDNTEDNRSQTLGTYSSDSAISSRLLEVPQRYAGYTPFPSPTGSSSGSPEPNVFNGSPVFRRGISPVPSSSSRSWPLEKYHLDAAHYHNESAKYHDTVAEYYNSAAEYHDRALLYHNTQARIQRVRFLSPVATFFPSSAESHQNQLNPCARQRSMAGSIHGSDPEGSENRLSSSSTLQPASIMSPTDPNLSAMPTNRDLAHPATQGSGQSESTTTKWIIRAKTPSFSSDSEQEAYNGPSVAMNADKGWEPDVKKLRKKGNSGSSCAGSSSSNASIAKHLSGSSSSTIPLFFGSFPQPGLQVPSLGFGGGHSRTSSGISGLSRITKPPDFIGTSETPGCPNQSELAARMLTPEQQVRNAENHAEAMKEAIIKAFKAREESEDRATAAEAHLKSTLVLRLPELDESVLMEKARVADEKFAVSQALLQKSRQRNVKYEDRILRAEALVQRLAEKVNTGIPALIHSTDKDVSEAQKRLEHAIERAEKAEQLLKDTAGSDEVFRELCEERAMIAEERAEAAEELQEKDRLWTVDADERAVNAESCLREIRIELSRSRDIITDLESQLIRARSHADTAEKDFKDVESEIEAFENRAMEFENEAYEFKTRFLNLRKYTDDLQKHHNAREGEFMACNKDWQDREESFVKQCLDLKRESDERIIEAKEEMKKLEQKVEDLVHDRALIAKTLTTAFQQMRQSGKSISQEDVDKLLAWATKLPELKKGKKVVESVFVVREKACRTVEGQTFTPSLDTGVFESDGASSSNHESAKPIETDQEPSVSKEAQTSPVDGDSGIAIGPSRFQPGVARLPTCSKGAWYAKMKNTKE